MIIFNTPMNCKETDYHSERCQVDVTVTLNHWEFEYLKTAHLMTLPILLLNIHSRVQSEMKRLRYYPEYKLRENRR